MGRKDTFRPDRFDIEATAGASARFLCLLIQQLKREQACMALVHVETFDSVISEGPEHPHTADSENHLLTER